MFGAFGLLLVSTLVAAWTGQTTISQAITNRAWRANSFAAFLGCMAGHWLIPIDSGINSLWLSLSPVALFAVLDVIAIFEPFPRWARYPGWPAIIGIIFGAVVRF